MLLAVLLRFTDADIRRTVTQHAVFILAGSVVYGGGTYNTSYTIYIPSAYAGSKTYYYWRCFYLCTASDSSSAEMTGGASFTVVGGRRGCCSAAALPLTRQLVAFYCCC